MTHGTNEGDTPVFSPNNLIRPHIRGTPPIVRNNFHVGLCKISKTIALIVKLNFIDMVCIARNKM